MRLFGKSKAQKTIDYLESNRKKTVTLEGKLIPNSVHEYSYKSDKKGEVGSNNIVGFIDIGSGMYVSFRYYYNYDKDPTGTWLNISEAKIAEGKKIKVTGEYCPTTSIIWMYADREDEHIDLPFKRYRSPENINIESMSD
ncbi:hypothetical protein K8R47_01920 [archaeon]|nr:hypothetical protein [archaeon]